MSSNEHPDMSGNPSDAPYVCEKCGHQFTDDAKLSGSFFDSETILCSQECSVEYDYAIAERLTADNARLTEKLAKHREYLLDHKAVIEDKRERLRAYLADSGRLRELLRECASHIPMRHTLAPGQVVYCNAHMDSAWKLSDRIKAAIEKGE